MISWMTLSQKFFQSKRSRDLLIRTGEIAHSLGFNVYPKGVQTKKYDLKSARWNQKPLKIALAADFHVGSTFVSLETLEDVVAQMNALEPDIILMPGDLVNSPYGHDGVYVDPEEIAKVLGQLKARYGAYATLGNHDIYEEPDKTWDALHDNGVCVLENYCFPAHFEGHKFNLVGVGDATTSHMNCKRAFAEARNDLPTIVMCHNPISTHQMPEVAVAVAGHTHGKQFRIPFLKQPALECDDETLNYGVVEGKNGNPVVITGGIGTSIMPFRNVQPEIVELTLSGMD